MIGKHFGLVAISCILMLGCTEDADRDDGPAARPPEDAAAGQPGDPAPGPANDTSARLTVAPAGARVGDQVTLTLTNRSNQQLGYNLCPVSLERQEGERWESRPELPAEVCTMELRMLAAGASATYDHTLPAIPPGTYRFRLGVEWPMNGGQVNIASEPFEVQS